MKRNQQIAAIYARTSKDVEDGFSLAKQVREMLAYAQRNNLVVPDEYIYEEDYTGTTLNRPRLNELKDVIESGRVQHLIVWKVDRLSRAKHHSQWILGEWLFPRGILLHVTDKNTVVRNEISDMLMYDIDANVAEEERKNIRKRTMGGRQEKAEQGIYLGQSHAPYGYDKEGTRRNTVLLINESEAQIVQLIYQMYVYEGLGANEIGRRLNAKGIPSPSKAKRSWGINPKWKADTIRLFLRDPRYIGIFYQMRSGRNNGAYYKKDAEEWVKAEFPELRIIDQDLYDAAQEIHQQNRDRYRNPATNEYLVAKGRLRCVCGKSISARTVTQKNKDGSERKYSYYCCTEKAHGRNQCEYKDTRSTMVDDLVWDKVEHLLRNPAITIENLRKAQEKQRESHSEAVMTLEAIETLRKEYEVTLARYYEDYEEGLMSKALFKQKKTDLDKRLQVAEELHKEYKAQLKDKIISDRDIERIIAECSDFSTLLDDLGSLEFDQKQTIVEMLNVTGRFEIDVDEQDGSAVLVLYLYIHSIPFNGVAVQVLSDGTDTSKRLMASRSAFLA